MKPFKNFNSSCSEDKFGTTFLLSNLLPNARNTVNVPDKMCRFAVPTAAHNMVLTIFVDTFIVFI